MLAHVSFHPIRGYVFREIDLTSFWRYMPNLVK